MVTIEEIKMANGIYEMLCKETEGKIAPLYLKRTELTSQISALESQINDLGALPKKASAVILEPLIEAYLAQLKEKYKDAPHSITPEDFVTLSYGILTVLKEPELVTNFKETLEYLTTELAKEGELGVKLITNHSGSRDGNEFEYGYSVVDKHLVNLPKVSPMISASKLKAVYLDLGKHIVERHRNQRGYGTGHFESEDLVGIPITCLAKRPNAITLGSTIFGGAPGHGKYELYILKKGEVIFQYPSKEAREEGHKSHEEMYRRRSATRGSEVDFLEEERQSEAKRKQQLDAQLNQDWERLKANIKSTEV